MCFHFEKAGDKLVGTCPTAPPLLPGGSRDQKCPSPSHAQPLRRAPSPSSMGGRPRCVAQAGQGGRESGAGCTNEISISSPLLQGDSAASTNSAAAALRQPHPHPRGAGTFPSAPTQLDTGETSPSPPGHPWVLPPRARRVSLFKPVRCPAGLRQQEARQLGRGCKHPPTSPHLGEPLLLLPPQGKTGASRFAAWEFI